MTEVSNAVRNPITPDEVAVLKDLLEQRNAANDKFHTIRRTSPLGNKDPQLAPLKIWIEGLSHRIGKMLSYRANYLFGAMEYAAKKHSEVGEAA
jgi:hypothetical protein